MGRNRLEATPELIELGDRRALDPTLVGAKAAGLARAASSGLATLPGFVLTTAWRGGMDAGVQNAWARLSQGGTRPLVVRSSSTAEDGAQSSMAGRFRSVLGVRDWNGFVTAVGEVLASRTGGGVVEAPMAVLVQPFVTARWGGVAFSADPITGRRDRIVVSVVAGGPEALVSGQRDGWTAALTRHGRLAQARGEQAEAPSRRQRRALARLARRAQDTAGGVPQDLEWAIDGAKRLWLLQTRPITTLHGEVSGPVFGPGPVAETFPEPLSPLERDLWLEPLDRGLREALALSGAASAARLRRSPVVVDVDGAPAVDLALLGVWRPRRGLLRRLDPRPPARRVRAAWRVGRLTAALPALARDVVVRVDQDLAAVPRLDALGNRALLAVLANGRQALAALHGYEALAGMLLPATDAGVTGASMALRQLAEAQAEGVDCDELLERNPVVLALVPPRIGGRPQLPAVGPPAAMPTDAPAPAPAAVAREALRLRARWVQELTARAADELGRRLAAVGVLADRASVRRLRFCELESVLAHRVAPADLAGRAMGPLRPLPPQFRLAADGTPMPVAATSSATATGAGGGRGRGRVHLGDRPEPGAVLVVSHLDPRLAVHLPGLGGLVAETGSPLSHLAILAREHAVPTVVGVAGARARFGEGDLVEVDGAAGTVTPVHSPPSPAPDLVPLGGGA